MPKALQHTLLSLRDLGLTFGPFVLLAAVLLTAAYLTLDPNPPRKVVMATGVAQGAYAEFGQRYASLLKTHGIEVVLRPTAGAAENLALLRDDNAGVDLAFVQGGADAAANGNPSNAEAPADTLVSLGSMFHEPVWLFYRTDSAKRLLHQPRLDNLTQLKGWRVNIGAPGSGVPPLMEKLIAINGLPPAHVALQQLPVTPAVVDLLDGRIDALVLASAPESRMVQMLLKTPGIALANFPQAEAYARRLDFISAVKLPRGVIDLAADMPPADLYLIAPTASLLAKSSLHPAVVQLFVQAAQQVHGNAGWFQQKGEFPNTANTEHTIAAEAQRVYRNGPPWLQRYMPFWLANLADRMWLTMLGIGVILLPLSRILPPVYEFKIRSRIFRWYGQLQSLEIRLDTEEPLGMLSEISKLESSVAAIDVPLSYADELYALRSHIQMVRQKLITKAQLLDSQSKKLTQDSPPRQSLTT